MRQNVDPSCSSLSYFTIYRLVLASCRLRLALLSNRHPCPPRPYNLFRQAQSRLLAHRRIAAHVVFSGRPARLPKLVDRQCFSLFLGPPPRRQSRFQTSCRTRAAQCANAHLDGGSGVLPRLAAVMHPSRAAAQSVAVHKHTDTPFDLRSLHDCCRLHMANTLHKLDG